MNIEVNWNCLENQWWFELGLGYSKTEYHSKYNKVITIALILFTIYIRWK